MLARLVAASDSVKKLLHSPHVATHCDKVQDFVAQLCFLAMSNHGSWPDSSSKSPDTKSSILGSQAWASLQGLRRFFVLASKARHCGWRGDHNVPDDGSASDTLHVRMHVCMYYRLCACV